jgi:hypothetical protein
VLRDGGADAAAAGAGEGDAAGVPALGELARRLAALRTVGPGQPQNRPGRRDFGRVLSVPVTAILPVRTSVVCGRGCRWSLTSAGSS